jgi:hypothetical protein
MKFGVERNGNTWQRRWGCLCAGRLSEEMSCPAPLRRGSDRRCLIGTNSRTPGQGARLKGRERTLPHWAVVCGTPRRGRNRSGRFASPAAREPGSRASPHIATQVPRRTAGTSRDAIVAARAAYGDSHRARLKHRSVDGARGDRTRRKERLCPYDHCSAPFLSTGSRCFARL